MSLQDKLNKLKYSLNLDVLNLRTIQRQINEIQTFKEEQNYDYLKGLLCPEKNQGMRIPSQIPQPTSCFQWRSTTTLKPNAKGSVFFSFNPFFLYDESTIGKTIPYAPNGNIIYQWYIAKYISSFIVCNMPDLDGNSEFLTYQSWKDVNQSVPSLYNNYRLVSAVITVKYIGPLEEAQGVIGGGIDYTPINRVGGRFYQDQGQPYDPNATITYTHATTKFSKFTNFDNIRHLTYSTENSVIEGLRMLYFPTDNNADCFVKMFNGMGTIGIWDGLSNFGLLPPTDQYKPGFNFIGYIQNSNPNSTYRIDMISNFEAIPNAEYLNYIPVSIRPYYLPWKERKLILDELKDYVVQKNN